MTAYDILHIAMNEARRVAHKTSIRHRICVIGGNFVLTEVDR